MNAFDLRIIILDDRTILPSYLSFDSFDFYTPIVLLTVLSGHVLKETITFNLHGKKSFNKTELALAGFYPTRNTNSTVVWWIAFSSTFKNWCNTAVTPHLGHSVWCLHHVPTISRGRWPKESRPLGTRLDWLLVKKSSSSIDPEIACSRLRDGGGKSFSNKKCEKRARAGERQDGGCSHWITNSKT